MEKNTIKVCKCDSKTPLIFTFRFVGYEYWCPRCGYKAGMFGAGINIPITSELKKDKKKLIKKSKAFLSQESNEWEYENNNKN